MSRKARDLADPAQSVTLRQSYSGNVKIIDYALLSLHICSQSRSSGFLRKRVLDLHDESPAFDCVDQNMATRKPTE
jgi:hypothetical protein